MATRGFMVTSVGRLASILEAAVLSCVAAANVVAGGTVGPEGSFDDRYRFHRSWTTADGLPSNGIKAVARTSDGFLWLGTHGGLTRFDGTAFKVFSLAEHPELGSVNIVSLCVDHDDALWIGTASAGVARYHQGRFTTYSVAAGAPEGLVNSLAVDRSGQVWAGGVGVSHFANGAFRPLVENASEIMGQAHDMLLLENGHTLLAAERGLFEISTSGWRRIESLDGEYKLARHIARQSSGEIWTRIDNRYARLADDRSALLPVAHDQLILDIDSRLNLQDGTLLVGADGIYETCWEMDGLSVRRQESPALPVTYVLTLFQDDEGAVWAGTNAGGLYQYVPRDVTVWTKAATDLPDGLLSIAETESAELLVVSNTKSAVYRLDNGKAKPLDLGIDETAIIEPERLLVARDGSIWIHHKRGLSRYSAGQFEHFEHDGHKGETPPMFEDSEGRIWCGGRGEICRFDGERFDRLSNRSGWRDVGLILSFCQATDGAIWIGADEGVLRFDGDSFAAWGRADGVPPAPIRTVREASDGNIWIGSYGAGMASFDGERFMTVDRAHGLRDNFISRIEEDRSGNFWINSNQGAICVKLKELTAVVSGAQEALACRLIHADEANNVGGCKTRDGRIFFATVAGLVEIDPNRAVQPSQPPRATILEVEFGGKVRSGLDVISVPPEERILAIRFTAPVFRDQEGLRFRYRLLGLDETWRAPTEDRSVRYSALRPGTYRFEVVARNSDGLWGDSPATLDLTILPYFVETRWFLALVVLAVVTGVFSLFQWRLALAHRRERRLAEDVSRRKEMQESLQLLAGRLIDAQEQERARVARELHDDLNQRLALLAVDLDVLSQQAANGDVGDRNAQLKSLAEDVVGISGDVHRMSYALHPSKLDQLGLVASLHSLCDDLTRQHGIHIHYRGPERSQRIPADIALAAYRICQESLQNALRHAGATEIDVRLAIDDARITLTVTDNGVGFDTERRESRAGLGLLSMRERARLVSGSLVINSKPGEGTRIEISINLESPPPSREDVFFDETATRHPG